MKQKCIRCVVQLSLAQLHWVDSDGVNIHLEGPPLFVRACVLGQLQHSHLHKPVFPVCLDQELTFDRVLTNCRNPSLFSEIIRGEHIKIELIQVAPDYRGGKILARFDTPAHLFLFPEVPPAKGELQHVELNKSRKYQQPPVITYSCSSTLLETTVQSPVDVIFNESQLDRSSRLDHSSSDSEVYEDAMDEQDGRLTMSALDSRGQKKHSSSRRLFQSEREKTSYRRYADESHSLDPSHRRLSRSQPSLANATTSGSLDGYSSARERLHSLLESYPSPAHHPESPKPVYRVKFKPPVPRFRSEQCIAQGARESDNVQGMDLPRPTTPTYRSPTVGLGPHEWEACPRRSPKRGRSHSLPSSPAPRAKVSKCSQSFHQRATTVPNRVPLDRLEAVHLDCGDPDLTPGHLTAPYLRPPFVVGRPDPKLISKRNFCGEVGVTSIRHVPTSPLTPSDGGMHPTTASVATATATGQSSLTDNVADSSKDEELLVYGVSDSEDSDNLPLERDPLSPSPEEGRGNTGHRYPKTDGIYSSSQSRRRHTSPSPAPARSSRSNPTTPIKSKPLQSGIVTSASSARRYSSSQHINERELVSKYLVAQPGNVRRGVASPSRVIVDKIQRLRDECCACLCSADELGEDELSEDLDRLKASLEAEREDTLNKSARLLPDQNVTVKIGPRDYWSRRMAEYTGKRHRVLFDETLEKIYNRLYRDAVNSS